MTTGWSFLLSLGKDDTVAGEERDEFTTLVKRHA